MASRFKTNLVNHIYNYCRQEVGAGTKYEIAHQLKTASLGRVKLSPWLYLLNDKNEKIKCEIPVSAFGPEVVDNVIESEESEAGGKKFKKRVKKVLVCESNPKTHMKDILDLDPTALSIQLPGRKVLVEFSSPNIAKPFHVGHLRSTIIGNVIANVKERLGEKVTRLNYLGDWGTQFGLLSVGMELAGYSEQQLKERPMQLLFDAYVKANQEAEKNPELHEKALKLFTALEEGDAKGLEMWSQIKGWTVDYLIKMYGRLGINFDEYHWESSYRKSEVTKILDQLKEKNLLETDSKQRICAKINDKLMPLMKSDGSTLYLIRDLGAIYDRREKYDFDQLYYVVENGQTDHFNSLFSICNTLGFDKSSNVQHVKFALVQGLSTRKGQVVLLEEVFDEAKSLMLERQKEKETTKIIDEKVADIAAISAVVVSDLKEKRNKTYEFDWAKVLDFEGDTGVKLQYTHCRLNNLLERFEGKVAKECDPEALPEEQAAKLATMIGRYEETVLEADSLLEPHIIAKYLLSLSRTANEAYQALHVENVDDHLAGQRLLLFQSSRKVLEDGLKLLGLKPLQKM